MREASRDRWGKRVWMCVCECGREREVRLENLRSGNTSSCGCLANEATRLRETTHGEAGKTPEYKIWCGIKQRCQNVHAPHYECYGGRGISVCDRWLVYANFLADMGRRPSSAHSIERKDNNGNYEPGNCVWATRKEQHRNTRQNVLLMFRGETKCLQEWCDELGMSRSCIGNRLRRGWPIERALT